MRLGRILGESDYNLRIDLYVSIFLFLSFHEAVLTPPSAPFLWHILGIR